MPEKHYQNITVTEKENAEIEITGEITAERLDALRSQAIKNLGKDAEFDGFRKGNVPEEVLVNKLGEQTVLAEAAELALAEAYPEIVKEHELDVIGRPQVSITKLAAGNPLGFTITTAVLKPITLPDYKALAKEKLEHKEEVAVTDEEVDAFITRILENQAKAEEQKENAGGESDDNAILGPDGQPIASEAKETKEEEEKKPLELTDEFVQSLGDFKDVADFKAKIKDNLKLDKERAAHEKKRSEIAEAIIEKTDINLPDMLVDYELEKMLAQFKGDIERMGLSVEDYMQKSGKDEASLRDEWRPEAGKRAKLQLVLAEIAKKEGVTVPREELDREVEHLLAHHKDADPERVRSYLEPLLQNEKVFQLLEGRASESNGEEKSDDTKAA